MLINCKIFIHFPVISKANHCWKY